MRVEFISGVAGTGKSYTLQERVRKNPLYGVLSASTGIAAANMGTSTIHSLLKYYDTNSMIDSYTTGKLLKHINNVAEQGYQNIVIDELSMYPGEQLDILCQAISQVNIMHGHDLGLVVCGDALQLPPVRASWFFESNSWPIFEDNHTHLTKIWRQSDVDFINSLNYARSGNGSACVDIFESLNIKFNPELDPNFKGTTILAKNDEVDRYNWIQLSQIRNPSIWVDKKAKGRTLKDWDKIPQRSEFKIGAYVMLLANQYDYENRESYKDRADLIYANGDLGIIKDYDPVLQEFLIELLRTKQEVGVGLLTRHNQVHHKPDKEMWEENINLYKYEPEQIQLGGEKFWSLGKVDYFPLRCAWASTTFKSQGLTLDKVQINLRTHFMGSNNQLYVALSRCRSAEGLRLVGTKELFVRRNNVDKKCLKFV